MQNAIIEKYGFLENFYPKDKENVKKDSEYDFLINLYFNHFSIVKNHYPHQLKNHIEKYIKSLSNEDFRSFVLLDKIKEKLYSFNEYKNNEKVVKKHFLKTYFEKMTEDEMKELIHDIKNDDEKWIRSANLGNFIELVMDICFEDFDLKNNYGKLKFANEELISLFTQYAPNNIKKFLKYDCVELIKNVDDFSKERFVEKIFITQTIHY